LPYESQRELARWRVAWQVLHRRSRVQRAAAPAPPRLGGGNRTVIDVPPASYSYRLRPSHGSINTRRPRLLMVTPFAVFPPQHGGARRTAGLLRGLRENFDIILVSDEASGYDARSFTDFDGLYGIHLVQRGDAGRAARKTALAGRLEEHQHDVLVRAVSEALDRYRPDIVHIEHVELAGLVRYRRPGQRWVLGLHDAYEDADFDDAAQAQRFRTETLARYDAVTACSPEDCALISHQRMVCVPNGSSIDADGYRPSQSVTLLFMGPFRYAPNLNGIREFLRVAYPAIRDAVPTVQLRVLGGNGASDAIRDENAFAQPGVEVLVHREDVVRLLEASALTINPLQGIRGSAIKVIESLTAGRVCVSTVEGARGFHDAGFSGLVTVDTIEQMIEPVVSLLQNSGERHCRERPIASQLAPYQWKHCAAIQRSLYTELLATTREASYK